jgi:hypothetical protein
MGVAGVDDLLVPAVTRSKCGVNLVSEQVPDVDHGAGMAGCRPVDYTFVKPSCD